MADDQKGRKDKPRVDEFTAAVVPDPKNPGGALLVTGFIGASVDARKTRIYFDASLSTYVDVETADIVHSQALTPDESNLGGSRLWLKPDAQVSFGSAGAAAAKGKFFEGPLMAAYGGQFAGQAAGAAGVNIGTPYLHSLGVVCFPTIACTVQLQCHVSLLHPCVTHFCTAYVACHFTFDCPPLSATCPVASPNCPPPGPGTPVQGGGGGVEAFAAQSQFCHVPTVKACTHQAACESAGCYPTYELGCPYAAPANLPGGGGYPSLICSYGPGCWYSWGACPTQYGCGPHHTPGCPQAVRPDLQLAGSYRPGCWYSFGACPTMYGCGPHHTPACPR